jgi:hypothetical protein
LLFNQLALIGLQAKLAKTIARPLPKFLTLFGIFQLILGICADVADMSQRGLAIVADEPTWRGNRTEALCGTNAVDTSTNAR